MLPPDIVGQAAQVAVLALCPVDVQNQGSIGNIVQGGDEEEEEEGM